ncbi:hypothetical protein JCM14036_03400 [Desulfotomaculum defluvii]
MYEGDKMNLQKEELSIHVVINPEISLAYNVGFMPNGVLWEQVELQQNSRESLSAVVFKEGEVDKMMDFLECIKRARASVEEIKPVIGKLYSEILEFSKR